MSVYSGPTVIATSSSADLAQLAERVRAADQAAVRAAANFVEHVLARRRRRREGFRGGRVDRPAIRAPIDVIRKALLRERPGPRELAARQRSISSSLIKGEIQEARRDPLCRQQRRLHEFLRERESPPDNSGKTGRHVMTGNKEPLSVNLPTISDDRVIQGDILKCVDGHYSLRDGTAVPPDTRLLAIATGDALQCWRDQTVIEVIPSGPSEELPDIDALNGKVPRDQWEIGLDDKPRPPWQHVYLGVSDQCPRRVNLHLHQQHDRLPDCGRATAGPHPVDASAPREACRAAGEARREAHEDAVRPENQAGIHHRRVARDWQ